jgi:hypothetical protein
MRRTIAALALTVLCTLTVTSCDKAKEILDSAGCGGLTTAAKALPANGDNISDGTIKGLASAAKAVQSAVNALPTDKLPAEVKTSIDKAVTDANDAAAKLESDPAAARQTATKAITSLQSAITKAKSALDC